MGGHALWDSSGVLPGTGVAGGLLPALTGYRARPDALDAAVLAAYWLVILVALSPRRAAAQVARQS